MKEDNEPMQTPRTSSLGELLAANIAQEERRRAEHEAAERAKQVRETQRALETAKRFFAEARGFFTTAIEAGMPQRHLFVQVGGNRGHDAMDINRHPDFEKVLNKHEYGTQGPHSLTDPNRFSALWAEFGEWAANEGLHPWWEYCHDGIGESSWWRLRVRPVDGENGDLQ